MTENELRHFGIRGMKWGVRRYQNENGTLTSAGKKRYSADDIKSGAKAAIKNTKSAVGKGTKKVKSGYDSLDENTKKDLKRSVKSAVASTVIKAGIGTAVVAAAVATGKPKVAVAVSTIGGVAITASTVSSLALAGKAAVNEVKVRRNNR